MTGLYDPVISLTMKRAALICLLFASCATVSTRLPEIDAANLKSRQIAQEKAAFETRQKKLDRLVRVATPILEANADICPKTRPSLGVMTHRLKSYDKALREGAQRELGAKDDHSIFYVTPGSAADTAGLKAGDELLYEDTPVSVSHKGLLAHVFETGLISIKRGEEILDKVISVKQACAYNLRLRSSSVINAYADGRNITFTTGMIDFVKSDEELAMIVGHEMAHNTKGHIRKIVTNVVLTGYSKRYTRPFESEADYVGLYYMARAGYNIDGVEDFWDRLSKIGNPKYIAKHYTHPSYPSRALFIEATRDEIRAKQASDLPLLPSPKSPS